MLIVGRALRRIVLAAIVLAAALLGAGVWFRQ
jgi:hypothetical protein